MTRVALAFPGALETPTGGYAYDREVLAHLGGHGVDAQPLALPAGFPFPDAAGCEEALRRLSQAPADCLLLVDGLALGALPADRLEAVADRLVGLVHHPLALEEGLSPEDSARLAASERAALARCRAVITTSPATARSLAADYGVPADRLTVAEPGVSHADRSPCIGEIPLILAVGSAIPRKSYPLFVSVLADLAHLPWTATIIGSLDLDPAEAARIRKIIAFHGLEGRIALRGAVSRAELDAAYGACDLFVHPALYEGYGMVLAEALRRGLPLICTTGGAAAETVPDGAGVKVPPGEAAPLRQALRHLLTDPDARRSLADRAFAAGQALPDWSQTAGRIARVLKGIADVRVAA